MDDDAVLTGAVLAWMRREIALKSSGDEYNVGFEDALKTVLRKLNIPAKV